MAGLTTAQDPLEASDRFNLEPRVAFRRILFCMSDRDQEMDGTWAWAKSRLLETDSDAITFVHVHRGMTLAPLPPNERESDEPFASWMHKDIVKDASSFRTPPRYIEISCNALTSAGDALLELLGKHAEKPDIVITGSRGIDSVLMRLLTTSTSMILAVAGDAVLCVRPRAWDSASGVGACLTAPRVVAIALDPSGDTARAQVNWAAKYLIRSSDEVKLLMGPGTRADVYTTRHSSASLAHSSVILNASAHSLERLLTAASAIIPECVALPNNMDIRDGIVDWLAAHLTVDVIVMGRRSAHKKLRRGHLGSVSAYVLRHAQCAVLIVSEETLHASLL